MAAWSVNEGYTDSHGVEYPLELVASNRDRHPTVVIKTAHGKQICHIPNQTCVAAEQVPGKPNEFRIRTSRTRDANDRVETPMEPIQGYAKRWNFTLVWVEEPA